MIKLDSEKKYRSEIAYLYRQTFSTGISAQHVNEEKFKLLLDLTYSLGKMYVLVDNEKLIGAAFVFPIKHDELFPFTQFSDIDFNHTMYFAELLVDENYRGKGMGGRLVDFVQDELKKGGTKQLVIRVWDQNYTALHLYQKKGFNEIAYVTQSKMSVDLSKEIKMNKIYLIKKL
jgi:GNAT superfamily N-acetyltransferase